MLLTNTWIEVEYFFSIQVTIDRNHLGWLTNDTVRLILVNFYFCFCDLDDVIYKF